jgi:Trk K+ transport system NAD-binding subunit
VISADDIGRELARRLIGNGAAVTLLDTDLVQVNRARSEGLDALQGDGTDANDLKKAGIKDAESFVAATSSDKTNLLACQIAMQRFDREHVVARVNNPDNVENFTSLGIRVTSPVVSTAMLLDSLVRRSAVLEMVSSQVPGQEVCEIEFTNTRLAGKPLHAWDLKGDVLVALVRRNGTLFVPHGDTVIQKGDTLTLIGQCEEIEATRGLLD